MFLNIHLNNNLGHWRTRDGNFKNKNMFYAHSVGVYVGLLQIINLAGFNRNLKKDYDFLLGHFQWMLGNENPL